MSRTLPTEDPELALSNATNFAVAPGPTGPINGRTLVEWGWFKPSLNLLVVIFTLNIPTFHASLGRISGGLGIRAAISVWKAVRTLDSLLIAALIAVLLKADAQATTSYWFFCACSLLQAVIGLVSSTSLIIYFSAYPTCLESVLNAVHMDIMSTPNGIVDGNGVDPNYSSANSARGLLVALICVSVVFFAFFLFHLRHLSRILTSDR
ncbi:hypothetical protein JOM56_012844 [Amanita muscaria]